MPKGIRIQHTNNTKANPLLLPGSSGGCDGHGNLLVTLIEVIDNLLALLLNLYNGGILLDDQGVEILHQLEQLRHLLLNLEQLLVAVLDSAQCRTSTALPVALHESLAEDLAVTSAVNRGLNLLFRSLGANNTILAAHLLLDSGLELGLDSLVLGDDGLDLAIDSVHVAAVHSTSAFGLGLDGTHPVGESAVDGHGLGGKGIQLAVGLAGRGAVDIAEDSGLKDFDLFQVAFDLTDAVADVAALVADGVGVFAGHAAGVLCQRSHLYCVACWLRSVCELLGRYRANDETYRVAGNQEHHGRQSHRARCCSWEEGCHSRPDHSYHRRSCRPVGRTGFAYCCI